MKFKFIQMSSTNEDRSLTSGIPIPQWMRGKTENYGIDPSTLSPPTHEGDFFYMKFPKPQTPSLPQQQQQQNQTPQQSQLNLKALNEMIDTEEKSFRQNTESFKKFSPISEDSVQVVRPKAINLVGVEDGFKTREGSACRTSVVDVAHQMLKEKNQNLRSLTRVDTEGSLAQPPPSSYLRTRRNSKSLPASPMTSPLTKRKSDLNQTSNRLFGLNFSRENDLGDSEDNLDKKSGSSWILSSLFAARDSEKDRNALVATSGRKDVVNFKGDGSGERKKASEGNATTATTTAATTTAPSNASANNSFFKSKPYLRDLNLLTPSSM